MTKSIKTDPVPGPWLLPLVFLVTATVLATRAWLSVGTPLFADTDDAMRLVVVRDFLAGQNWYDLTQHRLDTPYGAVVHWSRLVDLPIASLIFILTPLLGAAGATIVTAYLWPLGLLAAVLVLIGRLARRLLGPVGVFPALVLAVLNPVITTEFAPGRLDHHNVQILLTLAIVWTSIEALRRPGVAIAAGILCATALAIATESIPIIAAAIAVFGTLWVVDPTRGRQTRAFGISLAVAAMFHLALARPPYLWLQPACDMISPVYVGGALLVGIAFAAVTFMTAPRALWIRLLLLAGLGAVALAILLALYPQCLDGPYSGLDPWLRQHWLADIGEAKPWLTSVVDLPAYSLAVGLPVLFAIVILFVRVTRVSQDRAAWLILLAFVGFAAAVMLLQVRGARLAVMPAVPAIAWVIVLAWQQFRRRRGIVTALLFAFACLAFTGSAIALAVEGLAVWLPARASAVAALADKRDCLQPSAFADLKAIPPERIMTPIDLGSHMLMETPHAVVSAPYHRDADGIRDTFDFFSLPIDQARSILDRRGIGLVVTCPAMTEMSNLPDRASDSFPALVERNALPGWLKDVSLGGPLKIYAVLPR